MGGGRESGPTYDLADYAGGANYWYVDPSARQQQPASQTQFDPRRVDIQSGPSDLTYRPRVSESDALERLLRNKRVEFSRVSDEDVKHGANVPYGMTHFPNTEFGSLNGKFKTGIIEEDGTFWIVPVPKSGKGVEDKFMDTGNHFGGFDNLQDALIYEQQYLTNHSQKVGF